MFQLVCSSCFISHTLPTLQNALKLTAGVLKKYKGDQTVRLLQAWAQSGLGKTDAANQVALSRIVAGNL